MAEWSEWIDIERACARVGPFGDYGIYQVRVVMKDGLPFSITRFASVDSSGLVYIGRSGFRKNGRGRTVANRLREWLTLQHSGANTYARAAPILDASVYADRRLQARAMFVPDEEIEAAEARTLDEYFSRHAELPPCNSSTPRAFSP